MFREKDVLALLTFNSATYSLFYATTASTGTVFKDVYGLSETELGLCYIANGVGCLMATFVNGPRMTRDYEYVKKRQDEKKQAAIAGGNLVEGEEEKRKDKAKDLNDLSTFPIERARLRSLRASFPSLHF